MERPVLMYGLAYPRVDLCLFKAQNGKPDGLLGSVKTLRLEHTVEQPPGELFRLVRVCSYNTDGNPVRDLRFNLADVYESHHSYDSIGRKTRLLSSSGSMSWKTRYSYFDGENRIEVVELTKSKTFSCTKKYNARYNSDGLQIEASSSADTEYYARVFYQYSLDTNGRIIKLVTLNSNGDQEHEVGYSYDSAGNLVSESAYHCSRGLYKKTSFTYADGIKITETFTYDKTGSVEFRSIEKHDNEGNLLEVQDQDLKTAQEYESYRVYEFDSTRNWTQQLVYNTDPASEPAVPLLLERRGLTYY